MDTLITKSIKNVNFLSVSTSETSDVKADEDTNLYSILKKCKQEAQMADESGILPSPKYFQQAAVLSRKEKKYENEIAICKYYIKLVSQYVSINNFSKADFYEKVEREIDPFKKRIYFAKKML
ncbi:MAG: hypothetical protein HKN83_11765 [Gammaproteobacteria bacterium]|nr:hypothetical protein [Gammaproteobacteria bacterium]